MHFQTEMYGVCPPHILKMNYKDHMAKQFGTQAVGLQSSYCYLTLTTNHKKVVV